MYMYNPSTAVDIRLAKYRSGHLQPHTLSPHPLGAGETPHWLRTCIAAGPNGVCSTTNKSSGQDGCYPLRSGSLSTWSDTGSTGDSIRCLSTSNDVEVLYSGSDGGVRIWDISADGWNASGDYHESEVSPPERIRTISIRAAATALAVDDRLYIASSSGMVSVWSRHSFSFTHVLKISGDLDNPFIHDMVIGPNCRGYACHGRAGVISVW